jgi:hypothetical protein
VAELADVHPELFHYTGISGLEGIIKNQTLWATHATFLNDTTEINAFKERLPEILLPVVKNDVYEWNKSPIGREHIEQRGGPVQVIDDLIKRFTNGMYDALHNGTEPYITSFCTAENDEINQHGLLSQWRGYGQDGGYALVFDTPKLVSLMKQENEKWGYQLIGADVVYSPRADEKLWNEKFREEMGEDINKISNGIRDFMKTNSVQYLDNTYDPFVSCACGYKHWGFHEEREARIVAILHPREVPDEHKTQKPFPKEKERHYFARGGMLVPCIHLFDGITQPPDTIKRIIVGPHRDQDKRLFALDSLIKQRKLNIEVSKSAIPYARNY